LQITLISGKIVTMVGTNYNMTQTVKVGIDARMVFYRQAGIGQYILNLLREMAQLKDPRFALTVYQSRKEKTTPTEWLGYSLPERKLWTPPHHRYEQLALPIEIALGSPQVFHSPDFIPPFQRWRRNGWKPGRVASVITIHDLAFLHFPHLLTAESKDYYGQIKRAAASAERIIAVSESTARDVITQLGVSSEKVKVVYEAANPLFHPLSPTEMEKLGQGEAMQIREKMEKAQVDITKEFPLFVSTIEPRKNLPTLLKAYRRFLNEFPESQTAPKLVLAGREGWLYTDIYKLAEDLKLQDWLVWLGGVSTEELLWLYNRAAFLVMPSLYEGFGLPPLEALACGTPALVANTSSLPEVVGEVGVKLPPEDVEAWAQAIGTNWYKRAQLKAESMQTGPAQAVRFSWRTAAEETLEVYLEAHQACTKEVLGVRS
jgi:glycosyltransferase involved in cell wall biosynthesis